MRTSPWPFAVLLSFAVGCAHTSNLDSRLAKAEQKANAAEALIMDAEKQLDALEPTVAEERLAKARLDLQDPDIGYDPDAQPIRDRLTQAEQRIPSVRKQREKRDTELAVQARRLEITKALARFDAALPPLRQGLPSGPTIAEAKTSTSQLEAVLTQGAPLEAKDAPYADYVKQLRQKVASAQPEILLSEQRLDFVSGPAAVHASALVLLKQARVEKDPAKREDLFQKALDTLQQFQEQAKQSLTSTPALAKALIDADGKHTTPEKLVSLSETERAQVKKKLAALHKRKPAHPSKSPSRPT